MGLFIYTSQLVLNSNAGGSQAITGIGFDSTTAFQNFGLANNTSSTLAVNSTVVTSIGFNITGYHLVTTLEQGDGVNANTFDRVSNNLLQALIWL